LKRQFKDETIEINFDCQDEAEVDMDEEAMEAASSDEGDNEDEEPQQEYGINFEVKITKPSGDMMVVMCAASEKLIISSVRHIAAGKDLSDQDLYGGPVFDHLDDKLQDAFYAYLSDRNIDEDLCYFIMSYSREKEQKEYQFWLQKLLKFSEK
jgi:complement component 1 Q subcomponent-binding protein